MNIKGEKLQRLLTKTASEKSQLVQGYPQYPANEDIYNRFQLVDDPEDDDLLKSPVEEPESPDEAVFPVNEPEEDMVDDLDVPGSELDDEEERIGNEDEENNYYSLGGDNHDDLEEHE